jgi:hypothetical protein
VRRRRRRARARRRLPPRSPGRRRRPGLGGALLADAATRRPLHPQLHRDRAIRRRLGPRWSRWARDARTRRGAAFASWPRRASSIRTRNGSWGGT